MPRKRISELTATTTPTVDDDYVLRRGTSNFRYRPAFDLNIRSFGASPSATAAVNTAAINAALAVASSTKQRLYVPPHDDPYLITNGGGSIGISIGSMTDFTLFGAGPGASRLKLADGADAHLINIDGATGITIHGIELDCNRANQTLAVHGIRCLTVTGLWVDRLYIHDAAHYGVGLQGAAKEYVYLTNLRVQNTGGDGIDTKDTDGGNIRLVANNIIVKEFGLNLSGTDGQAGFDLRGPWQVSNYSCEFTVHDGDGIRTRVSPDGGEKSHVSNVHIVGPTSGTAVGGSNLSLGISSAGDDCVWTNAYIENCFRAVSLVGSRCKAKGITSINAENIAFFTDDIASDSGFEDCTARSPQATGFEFEGARSYAHNCKAFGLAASGGIGIITESTATGSKITNSEIVGPGAPSTAIGIQTVGADNQVLGGTVTSCLRGLVADAPRTVVIGVEAVGSEDSGILVNDGTVDADDTMLINCKTRGGADGIDVEADRCKVIGCIISSNSGVGLSIASNCDDTIVDQNTFTSNTIGNFQEDGNRTRIGSLNVGVAGLVGSSVDEDVVASASSANIDIAITSSRLFRFRVQVDAEDANGAREAISEIVQVYRSGSGAPATPTVTRERLDPVVRFETNTWLAYAGLVTQATLNGNSLRINISNGMGANCRMTIRVWEIDRLATPEDA